MRLISPGDPLKTVDVEIEVDRAQLVDEFGAPLADAGPRRELAANARRRKARTQLDTLADLYDGYSDLLVRTALIRSDRYDATNAPKIENDRDVARLCSHLAAADQEHVVSLPLNARNRLLAIHEVSIGGTSVAVVQAQHVLKVALLTSASAMIVVHNHPSGDPTPSPEDLEITASLAAALDCIGVTLLAHVVVAGPVRNGEPLYESIFDYR